MPDASQRYRELQSSPSAQPDVSSTATIAQHMTARPQASMEGAAVGQAGASASTSTSHNPASAIHLPTLALSARVPHVLHLLQHRGAMRATNMDGGQEVASLGFSSGSHPTSSAAFEIDDETAEGSAICAEFEVSFTYSRVGLEREPNGACCTISLACLQSLFSRCRSDCSPADLAGGAQGRAADTVPHTVPNLLHVTFSPLPAP